jgi:hypothetical protein
MPLCFPFLRFRGKSEASYQRLLPSPTEKSGLAPAVRTLPPPTCATPPSSTANAGTPISAIEPTSFSDENRVVPSTELSWAIARAVQLRLGAVDDLDIDGLPPLFEFGCGEGDQRGEERLFALLRDEAVMSPEFTGDKGATDGAHTYVSVWEALEAQSLVSSPGMRALESPESVMLYVPLEPGDDGVVELAQTRAEVGAEGEERAVWVPSGDRVSVHAFWWGYAM